MSWTLVVVMLASAAAAPCPVQDGAAPNDRACDCAKSTCAPGEYCQNFSSFPCAFPQCRQQVVPQGGQTHGTFGYLGRHLNFMHCLRCDPLDETKCAECDEESVLSEGTCLENTRIFSTYFAFAALDQEGTVTAWGDSRYGGSVPSGGLTGIRGSNPCSMGMFVDAGACGACPIGYASPAPNETQCWKCTGGRVADSEASISAWPKGALTRPCLTCLSASSLELRLETFKVCKCSTQTWLWRSKAPGYWSTMQRG